MKFDVIWNDPPAITEWFIESAKTVIHRLYDRILEETGFSLTFTVYDFDRETGEAFLTAKHEARNAVIKFGASDTHYPVNVRTGEFLRTYNKMMNKLQVQMIGVGAKHNWDVESMIDLFEPQNDKAFVRYFSCISKAKPNFLLEYVQHPFDICKYTQDLKPVEIPNSFYIQDIVGVERDWGIDRRTFADLVKMSPHCVRRIYYRPGVPGMIVEATYGEYKLYTTEKGCFDYDFHGWTTVVDLFNHLDQHKE